MKKMKTIHAKPIEHVVKIAIVISRFNQEISDKLLEGALERLEELEVKPANITIAWVPGAIELPLVAQALSKKSYQALICFGSVIRGQTDHYDYVCHMVSQGCLEVGLKSKKPVIFGVLTTNSQAQAMERCGGNKGHKGRSAVDAAMEMISVLTQIEVK